MSERGSTLRIRFDRGDFALDVDVSWQERVVVLFGPSGSGKSTVFETILGLHRSARADIRLDGIWLDASKSGLYTPPHRRELGWVPQESALFPHLSVRENVGFGRARAAGRVPHALARATEVLEITDLLDRTVDQLSGGERQRVAIARALASGPRALLFDEPLASLDLPLRARVLPYLLRVRDELGLPMLYITHDPDEALLVGEAVVVLDRGRVVAAGEPRDVLWSRAVLPLSEALGLENVFEGRITGEDEKLLFVAATGLRLELPFAAPRGEAVRIGLRAEDVLLAAEAPGRISARNVLTARVVSCEERGTDVFVRLAVGEHDSSGGLVAKITRSAAVELEIAPGRGVYAIVKAQALKRLA